MIRCASKKSGFTIVELLIVIVVIGILASITVVSYSGVTSRANDSVVQNDLSNLARKLQIYEINNGVYPKGVSNLNSLEYKTSATASYAVMPQAAYNLSVCFSLDGSKIAVVAMSSSKKVYQIYSGESFAVKNFTQSDWHNEDTTTRLRCQAIDTDLAVIDPSTGNYAVFNGYSSTDTTNGPWRIFTKGGV